MTFNSSKMEYLWVLIKLYSREIVRIDSQEPLQHENKRGNNTNDS